MSHQPEGARADRRRTAALIVVLQLFFAVATVPLWAFLGLMKMGEDSAAARWLFDAAILGYPLALVVAVFMSWRAWGAGRMNAALRWNLPPLAWVVGLAALSAG